PDDLAAMREALEWEKSLAHGRGRTGTRRTFHQLVSEAARNTVLEMMCEPVFRVLETKYLAEALTDEVYEGLWSDHAAIFEAIEAGGAEAAAAAMTRHLASLRGVYRH